MKIAVFDYEKKEYSLGLPVEIGAFVPWVYRDDQWIRLEIKSCDEILP